MSAIVGALPSTIRNGDTEDATVVMALFAFIQSQVNGNACPATTGAIVLKGDGAGGTTGAAPGVDYFVPVPGMVFDYAGGTVPNGYLLCDGSAVSRVTYATLFTNIGTTWGAGDGSTTFNLPDLRRRTTIGAGGVAVSGPANTLAAVGGEETHVLTTAELAAHNHPITVNAAATGISLNDSGHAHTWPFLQTPGNGLGAGGFAVGAGTNQATTSNATGITVSDPGHGHSASSSNTGSGTAHNNMQPSAVVNKIIKV